MPTLFFLDKLLAIEAVIELFPTPPFADPNAIIFLMPI
jgi:hypothetical protein